MIEALADQLDEYSLVHCFPEVAAAVDNSMDDDNLADDLIDYPVFLNNNLAA